MGCGGVPPASCILPGQPLGKWWLVGYAGRIWDLCYTSHEKHFLGHWAMDRHCPPKGGVLKTSSSVCGTTGRWQNHQEGWKEVRPSGGAFGEETGPLAPPSLTLLPGCHKANSLALPCPPVKTFCLVNPKQKSGPPMCSDGEPSRRPVLVI